MTLVRHFRAETQTEDERLYLQWRRRHAHRGRPLLDLATRTWVTPTPVGEEVLPLLGHTAAAIGAELWASAAATPAARTTTWKLDTTTHERASFRGAHAPTGMVPPPSSKHDVGAGTKPVVLGELPPEKLPLRDDVQRVAAGGGRQPAGRARAHRGAAAFIGEELHVFGGLDVAANNPTNTMHLLDTRVMERHIAAAGGATPTERVGHAMCALGARLRLGGLETGGRYSASFGRYDAWALLREALPDGTSPSARVGHAIASFDEQLYVWGRERRAAARRGGRPRRGRVTGRRRSPTWRRSTATRRSAPMPIVGHAMAAIDVAPGSQLAKDNFKFVGQKLPSSAAATAARRPVTRGSSTSRRS